MAELQVHTGQQPSVPTGKCTSCGKTFPFEVSAAPAVLICPNCRFVTGTLPVNVQRRAKARQRNNQLINFGAKCTFGGISYQLVSFCEKYESRDTRAIWHEYGLRDSAGNYAFLSESYGHWTFLRPLEAGSVLFKKGHDNVKYNGLTYEQLTQYKPVLVVAKGEFDYDVFGNTGARTTEFISPPYMISAEDVDKDPQFFAGEYKLPRQIAEAFPDEALALPSREGVGACQPFFLGINPLSFIATNVFVLILGLCAFGVYTAANPSRRVAEQSVLLGDTLSTATVVSPSFDLYDNKNLLEIHSAADLNNDWIETVFTLVNEVTGEEKYLTSGFEWYTGYDSDGSWSEGSRSNDDYIQEIDPGRYHLEATVSTGTKPRTKEVMMVVRTASPIGWNFMVVGLSLAVISGLVWYGSSKFEDARRGY